MATCVPVFVVIIICCLGAMKIKDCRTNDWLDLFQTCYVPEDVSVTFNSEVDLNDDAVGRYLASSGSVRSTSF